MALSAFIKEFFGTIKGVAEDSSGNDVFIEVEADGTPKTVNYGNDPDGNREPFSLNADHVLKVDVVSGAVVQVDPVVLTVANAAVYNPGTVTTEIYDVWFNIANSGAASCLVSVGVDLGGGTTLDRIYWDGYTIPAEETTGWHYLGRIAGDDDIVATNATAATVVATIFLKVNRLA